MRGETRWRDEFKPNEKNDNSTLDSSNEESPRECKHQILSTGKVIFLYLISDEIMICQILFGLTLGICLMITLSACLVKRVPGKIVSVDG